MMTAHVESRRRAPRALAVLLLAALLVACPQTTITEPISNLPFATASPSCSPVDGPAVEITLAASGNPATVPRAHVTIYQGLASLTSRWTLGPEVGVASYMASTDSGELARSGTVVIESVDATKAVTGTVNLVFPVAGMIKGRFVAGWVPRTVRCG